MLHHVKQSLTKLFAPGTERMESARVRGTLERLEDRTMLSASHGMMAYNHGGPVSQSFGDSAAFAPQPMHERLMSSSPQTFVRVSESGPAYRDDLSHPAMMSAFAPPPQQRMNLGQQWSMDPGWSQFVAPPPPREHAYAYHSEPGLSPYATSYYSEYALLYYVPVSVHDLKSTTSADPDGAIPSMASGLKATQKGTGILPGDLGDSRRMASQDNHVPLLPSIDYVGKPYGTTLPVGNVLASILSTTYELPNASQTNLRETSTSSALNAVAREVAFQEFSSSLFQSNTAAVYDRVNVESFGRDTMQPEVVDGLIRPAGESGTDAVGNSLDAVSREREAVDAVLEELHDLDFLLPETGPRDLTFKLDLQTDTGLDELPAGEIDGGMVLLQSTGDANGNGFDLTPVYAEHLERFSAPAKMETSVGIFQAIDVAMEDAPITEPSPQIQSTSASTTEAKLEEALPTKREQTSSNKSAAIVGATTAAGALVWLNRPGSRFGRPQSSAQKRRAVCS